MYYYTNYIHCLHLHYAVYYIMRVRKFTKACVFTEVTYTYFRMH